MTVGVSTRATCSRLVGAAFLAGMLAAVSVSSTPSWAQSSPEQEGVNKPIKKKPSRKTASSPAATTESAKGEGQSSTGTALDRRRFRSYSEARMAVFQFPPERTLVMWSATARATTAKNPSGRSEVRQSPIEIAAPAASVYRTTIFS
jgi:hypothetical protein